MSGNKNKVETGKRTQILLREKKKHLKVIQEREFEAANCFNMHIINCETL